MPEEESPKYYAVLTETGAKMEARALAQGRGVVLIHIVVGDAKLEDVVPKADVTELVREVCRRPIEYRTVDETDKNVTLLHAVIPSQIGGFWVRELGVVGHIEDDDEEILYAYANHAPYYKMLPQSGQTVTHEITVPILQSTDARLTIVVSENGYASRAELEAMQRKMGEAITNLSANALRLSNRVYELEGKHI